MARNYYVILGVPSDASLEEIQAAYRRLAKASHPDVSGADSGERFREVQEAWETLGDAERRHVYDMSLQRTPRPSSPSTESMPHGWHHAGRDVNGSAFDSVTGLFDGPDGTYVSTQDGQEIHFGLEMTAAEVALGGTMPLRIPVHIRCPECAGLGSQFMFFCPACEGTGYRSYWRTVTLKVPAGLTNHSTLEVPLARLGVPYARLILHVQIEP
jgi:molecular chaperone DnaJ